MQSYSALIAAVKDVLSGNKFPVALHEPTFAGNEWQLLKECLDSGYVSSIGEYVTRFEQRLADYLGAKHVVAVMNGTAALHMSLLLTGVEADDEVIVPALSFVATANAVTYCGAIPHFVDSNKTTLGLNPLKLEQYLNDILLQDGSCWRNRLTDRRVAAIVPMHTFGHPVDMDVLNRVAEKYSLPVIEDAAEALGSRYKDRMAGTLSGIAAISFNGNKTITTGGGGAIVIADDQVASRAKHLSMTARVQDPWEIKHDEVGFNYRMPNINAALGCAQLEQIDDFIDQKRCLANAYQKLLSNIPGVIWIQEPDFARSNYWLNAIMLDQSNLDYRNKVIMHLHKEGIMARPAWTLINKLPMYKDCPRMDLSIAEELEQGLICLPSSPFLLKAKI